MLPKLGIAVPACHLVMCTRGLHSAACCIGLEAYAEMDTILEYEPTEEVPTGALAELATAQLEELPDQQSDPSGAMDDEGIDAETAEPGAEIQDKVCSDVDDELPSHDAVPAEVPLATDDDEAPSLMEVLQNLTRARRAARFYQIKVRP